MEPVTLEMPAPVLIPGKPNPSPSVQDTHNNQDDRPQAREAEAQTLRPATAFHGALHAQALALAPLRPGLVRRRGPSQLPLRSKLRWPYRQYR